MLYMGYRGYTGLWDGLRSLVSFGIWMPPWERGAETPPYRGLGIFDVESFEPAEWTPHHTWLPVDLADRYDEYWAAKILLEFTPAHIDAAIDAAYLSDRRTASYLRETLLGRQRKLLRYALQRVAPLENFELEDVSGKLRVCFEDLWVSRGFGLRESGYRARAFDFAGAPTSTDPIVVALGERGRACVGPLETGAARDGYTIVHLDVGRGAGRPRSLDLHIARDAADEWRVIGIERR